MSTLTRIVRKLVGSGKTSTGYGEDVMYVGLGKVGPDQNEQLIELMKSKFETWELVRLGDLTEFTFIIRDSKNNYVGHCRISRWTRVDIQRKLAIYYSDFLSEEETHKFNNGLGCLVSYKKIN